jgi:hypothetical protein
MLDVDRTFANTRAARHAIPDHLIGDRVRHERLQLDDPRAARRDERGLVRHLVAEIHDQQLRRERLPRVPRRADLLAAAALSAREEIQHLLA